MRFPFTPIILLSAVFTSTFCDEFSKLRQNHVPQQLSADDLQYLSSLTDTNHLTQAVDNILIPRVVGTNNHEKVLKYIVKELKDLGWDVEIDEFQQKTPILGDLTFKNIIASLNPNAERYLVFACHYDSKYFPNGKEFVAATDSAVPCAMMLNLAQTLRKDLEPAKRADLSLKLIFFDGEEAFENWGPNDSIYGAKHLAKKLSKKKTLSKSVNKPISHLQQMDVLILLDLLGAANPNIASFFPNTDKWFMRLANAESDLEHLRLLDGHHSSYFKKKRGFGRIEDDHIPFLNRGVPILHLIPTPFPSVWHTPEDNRSVIHWQTVKNLNSILRVFTAEYLHLSRYHTDRGFVLILLIFSVILVIFIVLRYSKIYNRNHFVNTKQMYAST